MRCISCPMTMLCYTAVACACGKSMYDSISMRCVYAFMMRFKITIRKQCGSLVRHRPAHRLPPGRAATWVYDGIYEEDLVENMDETHFVSNMDNRKTVGFKVQEEANYADVVSGGESMTLVLRLSSGVNSKFEPPFIIVMNKAQIILSLVFRTTLLGYSSVLGHLVERTTGYWWNDWRNDVQSDRTLLVNVFFSLTTVVGMTRHRCNSFPAEINTNYERCHRMQLICASRLTHLQY